MIGGLVDMPVAPASARSHCEPSLYMQYSLRRQAVSVTRVGSRGTRIVVASSTAEDARRLDSAATAFEKGEAALHCLQALVQALPSP